MKCKVADIRERLKREDVIKFKDSRRCWWRITAWKSGEQVNSDNAECPDFEYGYIISREGVDLFHGQIVGQGDESAKVRDILYDYLTYISLAMLDASREIGSEYLCVKEKPNDN